MNDEDEERIEPDFSPTAFMRARRPYLYSDTEEVQAADLTRDVLSYHLETLTKQKDEICFELFAQRLAQKFISPNVRPQTGPTAGGDGKSDAETYPVTEEISARWFVGDPADGRERMAFAFSTEKDWRPKVRSDVRGLAGTGRPYRRIYFISNQYVPSKQSAEVQDELEKAHGIPVMILDRTWLLDRVINDDSIDIALDTLGATGATQRAIRVLGARDYKRQLELNEIEARLLLGGEYPGSPHTLIDDAHRAAILSRGLGRPRHEVDGKFQRAIRLAKRQSGNKRHLGIIYDQTWTANFWFDDFEEVATLYDEVEKLAIDSDDANDLELLANLLPLLQTAVEFQKLEVAKAKIGERLARLKQALEKLGQETARPNNAYHAQSLALLLRLTEAGASRRDPSVFDPLWVEFEELIKKVEGLGTFPFEPIAEALSEIGAAINSPAFDRLYEVLTDALAARKSEGEAAKRSSQRGFQKLEMKLSYEAIRWFGRAVGLLTKDEYRDELVQALIGSSVAYEAAGLHWAARNYALAAASLEFQTFRRSGSLEGVHPATLKRWMVTELSLGRVPYILAAHEIAAIVRRNRAITNEQKAQLDDQLSQSAMWIGALLLRMDFDDLAKISRFPDCLERLGLAQARVATLYLMGEIDVLRQEGSIPKGETDDGADQFFQQWSAFGSKMSLPDHPHFCLTERIELRSGVLGCDLAVSCANNLTSISIGEALLGTIEALLATSLNHRVMPTLDHLTVLVDPSPSADLTPRVEFAEEGITIGHITHRADLRYASYEEALTFPKWLRTAAVETFTKFAVPTELEEWGSAVLREEQAFSRALTFSNVPSMTGLMLGNPPKLSIADWQIESDRTYEVRRQIPWKRASSVEAEEVDEKPIKFGDGEPPARMLDLDRLKHSDFRIVSPIDVRKWDAAGWTGAFFMVSPGNSHFPPVLGVAFTNMEAGEAIFRGLRSRFGTEDSNEELRIAIIRGARISNPHAYGVSIGANLDKIEKEKGKIIEFGSKNHIMTPSSSENLDRFLYCYREHGRYLLVPAMFNGPTTTPEPNMDLAIGKHELVVREAWEIGPNDPDVSILDENDPPVVPMDQPEPPALKALAWFADLRRR